MILKCTVYDLIDWLRLIGVVLKPSSVLSTVQNAFEHVFDISGLGNIYIMHQQ